MTHAQLCEVAKKWLKRPISRGGHGCHVALSECRSGWSGEMPDAIGFRAAPQSSETVLIEVKVSRSDFLSDFKKAHRAAGEGLGLYRYYMCPEGLIRPEEVPARWGLLYVNSRNQVTVIRGLLASSTRSGLRDSDPASWMHTRDTDREIWLLVSVMAKIEDPDRVKSAINAAQREQARLVRICNAQASEIQALKMPKNTSGWGNAGHELKAIPRKVAKAALGSS